ncbi:MAG: pyridoxamine 5'-phosphate oxidase family protein [Desulfosalsimonadaceae bacterium]
MAISEKVKDILLNKNRINILSTSNKKGQTDVAVFGSALLTDNQTVSFVLKNSSRSLTYIKENPYASCLILLPEEDGKGLKIRGCRLYLKADFIELSRNPVFLNERTEGDDAIWEKSFNIERNQQEGERKIFKESYLVRFNIIETRPIVDMNQGI